MIFLLDVNALIAIGFSRHVFHERVTAWVADELPQLATCAITEIGFVRVLAQATAYGFTVEQARTLLLRLKRNRLSPFTFLPDDHDVSHLPAWVTAPKQVTDGHLSSLAGAHKARLATLDENIRGSYVIPK